MRTVEVETLDAPITLTPTSDGGCILCTKSGTVTLTRKQAYQLRDALTDAIELL